MAEGLPTPKSREQILSEMLTEYTGLTGVNDLNTGSVLTQFFDVVARSVARTSGDIFQVLRDYSVDRATGEALNRIGEEERVPRKASRTANGIVKVTDSSFKKISTKIYAGLSAPNAGSNTIKVSDASEFPASGTIYIGRGTPNIEGPLSYSSVTQLGSYWEITLTSPTTKFHNISETVILGQGGTRNIPTGTTVISPGSGAVANISYTVSSSAILLDGENVNPFVQVVAQEPGSASNAPTGAIREFGSPPFTGAEVVNERPFTTGADTETDDDYRDRIKKTRLSKGLGTSLAVKNAVLGAQASDENAIVTSNEIDTTNAEETILYIDNGQGYEEKTQGVGIEFIVDSAIGGERSFQLSTGGRQTSVAKAFLLSSEIAPYNIKPLDSLAVLVGGLISEHTFKEGDFKSSGSATAYEIVASINNNTALKFEATTAEGGSKVLIQAKTEADEFLQLSSPSQGNDAGVVLGFPKNETRTVLLYKNRELLNKNGKVAFIVSKNRSDWSNTITNNDTLIISVDGTGFITYTFTNEDFIAEGQHSIVNYQNTLSSWVNVINKKITGVTASRDGERLKITSNLGSDSRASISISPSSLLVAKGMFSESLGLFSQGNKADFEISRNTAQIRLNTPLEKGDSLSVGSQLTKAEIRSQQILGGNVTITNPAYMWLLIDDVKAEPISTGVTSDTFLTVSKHAGNILRYTSNSVNAFGNVKVGDYVIIWSNELSLTNRLEARVNAFTATTLDVKVTAAEYAAAVEEGPVKFSEGFTVVRCSKTPQKLKILPGISKKISDVAIDLKNQLTNSTVTIDNNEVFIIRTNTEGLSGGVFLIDFDNSAKPLSFVKNSISQSITSQFAFYESNNQDNQFPAFIHSKITTDVYADPSDTFISNITSNDNIETLGMEPSGFVCFSQPYSSSPDIVSTECVEIENITGTTVDLERSPFYRRSRADDRYHLLNGYDFGHDDSVVAILDGNPDQKAFDMPLYRTAVTNTDLPVNPNEFRGTDLEGGGLEFSQLFGSSFSFNNYKCLMQAKRIIDPSNSLGIHPPPISTVSEDAILYRAVEWGKSGEKIGIGYFYPASALVPPAQPSVSHTIEIDTQINIKIFLKSGASRLTSVTSSTEWNVTISPDFFFDLVTYQHSGTGTAPGLDSVIPGDYVHISDTGEFEEINTGSFKIYSSTPTSFTIKRATGVAVPQTNVATLQNNTISFFESSATTASDIVDYVNNNLQQFITASLINDNGTSGAGVISDSTEENLNYTNSLIRLVDGKNFILNTALSATAGNPQFIFKKPLSLSSFSTKTPNAYLFNNGEKIKLIPTTANHVSSFLNTLAVTGFATLGEIKTVNRNSKLQLSTDIIGEEGSVQVVGGFGVSAFANMEGSAIAIGNQSNRSCIISINAATALGFHSDQWTKVNAVNKQKKLTLINGFNSIKITSSTPVAGSSKIEIFDRSIEQRLFGRNRYHTRTNGRSFRVEKQGQFACISWNEIGTQPFFSSNINLNNATPGTLTIFKNPNSSSVDITVDTGSMRFDEAAIGDLLTISNRLNPENNGQFLITGISTDYKTIRIVNENAVNELASGFFTIVDNMNVVGASFTVGTTTIPVSVGVDVVETAKNTAAAISAIPNITAFATGSNINVVSDIPNVTVALGYTGIAGAATVSGAFLFASVYYTADVVVKSEVQEGDSVNILSDFDELNQGVYRVIRRFKNSIYIDNPNAVEEEVTLTDKIITTNANSLTDYNITKLDGVNKLSWAGNGAEPLLEKMRPGDIITLGTDFNVANRGSFHVVDSGEKLQEITKIIVQSGSVIISGQYALINSANDVDEYYLWYDVTDSVGVDPAPGGKDEIKVEILSTDTAATVAIKTAAKLNTSFGSKFTAVASQGIVTVTTVGFGPTTNASNVNIAGDFNIQIIQQGRRNFVDYINVYGVTESGIVISDILQFHREALKFKEYEGAILGDTFVITDSFLGSSNKRSFVVSDVLSENEIIVTGASTTTEKLLLSSNFDKIYLEEAKPYLGYKKISFVSTDPDNLNNKNIIFDSANQFEKIGEVGDVYIEAMSKLNFPSAITKGLDAYKYNTGLIAEANRIVYGDPRDSTTYPGVAAAGAEIFIKPPLVKRIVVSISVRIKTGIPFVTIAEEVRNSVAALINANPVGQSIPISNIISAAGGISGIQAVAISSPQYDVQNDIIRINAGEKSFILDIISDITVAKIE